MTSPGVFKWLYSCSGQVLNGDGLKCVVKADTMNQIILLVGVALLIYGIYKRDKVKIAAKKAYRSLVRLK